MVKSHFLDGQISFFDGQIKSHFLDGKVPIFGWSNPRLFWLNHLLQVSGWNEPPLFNRQIILCLWLVQWLNPNFYRLSMDWGQNLQVVRSLPMSFRRNLVGPHPARRQAGRECQGGCRRWANNNRDLQDGAPQWCLLVYKPQLTIVMWYYIYHKP